MIGANTNINIVINALDKTAGAFKAMEGRMKGIADRMGAIGSQMSMAVTAPLTIAGGMAVKTAAQFDEVSRTVRGLAVAGGVAEEGIKQLNDMAIEFGKKGIFGPTEVMRAMEDMIRDGMKPAEIAGGRLKGVYTMAAAGAVDMATAQIILSDTMTAYGATVEETTRYVDALVGVTLETPAVMRDLSETMKYVAPVAAGLSVDIEELSGMIGILAEHGIRGSMAGTALRRSFINLSSPTAEAKELMSELNIQVFDSEGRMKSMVEVVTEISKGLEGMSEKQRMATLETIFGARAVTAWMGLVEAGPEALAKMTEAVAQQGRAKEVAEERQEGLAASLKKIGALWEVISVKVMPVFAEVLGYIAEKLKVVVNWFVGLNAETKKAIVIIAMLAAALGPLLVALSVLIKACLTLKTAISGIIKAKKFLFVTMIPKLIAGVKSLIAALKALIVKIVVLLANLL